MKFNTKKMIWICIIVLIFAAALWGPLASRVEQAKYTIVQSDGFFEIRDYAPMLIAQVSVEGERDTAINEGFKQIADFIFGNNTATQNTSEKIAKEKIAMTAPVVQKLNEKIAMTAPVAQQGKDKTWTVHFVMPSTYSEQTLPKPNNPNIKIIALPAKRFASIRFAGFARQQRLDDNTQNLMQYIQEKNLKAISTPTYAFYNPPWTLPFLRRNEVLIEIETK